VAVGREEIGQRSETVRRANLSAIVRELHARGPQTRSALVNRTGLTRSAIRGLIGELAAAGLVSEASPQRLGTPGRPSPLVSLDPDSASVLAIEISVDSLAVAIVGLGGVVIELTRVDRPRGDASVNEVVGVVAKLTRDARSRRRSSRRLIGVGAAIVGVVRRTDGMVSIAPNLGWRNVPLGARLSDALGLSLPVSIANDADLGALAEHRRGAAVGVDDLVFISGEVGVGGGLLVDGKPLDGIAGYAGELGHMSINPNGAECRCGSVGCWETEIGEDVLLRLAGHPDDLGLRGVDEVLRAASENDPVALAAIDHVGHWLGLGIASLINLLNPRLVVLGGRFARLHPYVGPVVEAELDRRALAAPRDLVRVVPSTLGVDAPLLGAAELAFEPLLADPALWLGRRDLMERASA